MPKKSGLKASSRTKTGNTHARCALVEGAWAYRWPATVSRHLQLRLEKLPQVIQAIRRMQERWYPTHGYQRDQPSLLLAPALPMGGGEGDETLNLTALPPLDSGSHINTRLQPRERSERRPASRC